jgi:hypothetical protein
MTSFKVQSTTITELFMARSIMMAKIFARFIKEPINSDLGAAAASATGAPGTAAVKKFLNSLRQYHLIRSL